MIAAIHGILEQRGVFTFPRSGFAQFDGVDDYISIPSASHNNALQAISVLFWINFTTTANTVVFEKSPNNTNYLIQTAGGAQAGRLLLMPGTVNTQTCHSKVINDGLWHSFMGTYSSNKITIYTDGVLDQENASAGGPPSAVTTNWLLGSRSGTAPFPGKIGNLLMYNRVLTLAEYEAYIAGTPPAGFIAAYALDGNANDTSSYANHGTEFNGVTYGTI